MFFVDVLADLVLRLICMEMVNSQNVDSGFTYLSILEFPISVLNLNLSNFSIIGELP